MGISTENKPSDHILISNPTTMNKLAAEAAKDPRLAKDYGTYGSLVDGALRRQLQDRPSSGEGVISELVASVSDVHRAGGIDELLGNNKKLTLQRVSRAEEITQEIDNRFRSLMQQLWQAAENGQSVLRDIDKDGHEMGPAKGPAYTINFEEIGDGFEFLQMPAGRPDKHFPDGTCDGNSSPKDTPANDMVKMSIIAEGHKLVMQTIAEHLSRGHKYTVLPGNHDNVLGNPYVWDGEIAVIPDENYPTGFDVVDLSKCTDAEKAATLARPGAEHHFGLKGQIRNILKSQPELSAADVEAAMDRMILSPLNVVGGDVHLHGHHCDEANITARPFKEFIDPTGLREEMPSSFGDIFVRNWFLAAEDKLLTLDGKDSAADMAWSMFQPGQILHRWKMYIAAVKALGANGYEVSPEAEAAQRQKDLVTLIDRFPDIADNINTFRSQTGQEEMSKEKIADGLHQVFEKAGAVGLQQSFKSTENILKRIAVKALSDFGARHDLLGKILTHTPLVGRLVRPWDLRGTRDRFKDLATEMNVQLGLSGVTVGHTHVPETQTMLTSELAFAGVTNTHTWTPKDSWSASDDEASQSWDKRSGGVKITELGVDADGKPYLAARLCQVKGTELLDGSLYGERKMTGGDKRKLSKQFSAMVDEFMARRAASADATQGSVDDNVVAATAYQELVRAGLDAGAANQDVEHLIQSVDAVGAQSPGNATPAQVVKLFVEQHGIDSLRSAVAA